MIESTCFWGLIAGIFIGRFWRFGKGKGRGRRRSKAIGPPPSRKRRPKRIA